MEATIKEIITKEAEAYQLIEWGLLPSVEEGVRVLLPQFAATGEAPFNDLEGFQHWRKEVLTVFYKQIAFNLFIRQRQQEPVFQRFLFQLKKRVLGRYRQRYTEQTIDDALTIPPHTLAFKLSALLASEQSVDEQPHFASFQMPSDIENLYQQSCLSFFPIDLPVMLSRLEKEDREFWDELLFVVKRTAANIVHYIKAPVQSPSDIIHDTWSDSSLLLREKIRSTTLPAFENALHFKHFIARICQNKCYESLRKNKFSDLSLDDPDQLLGIALNDSNDIMEQTNPWGDPYFLSDIDPTNNNEVGRALTAVLWDKMEPWFGRLTAGIEEKVAVFLLHYIDNKSYEEIAKELRPTLSNEERIRFQNKLRQDVVRVRALLKQRFMRMLADN